MPNFSIVFIIGEGHSGSTLLARMLDMHPEVICGGEMLRLETALVEGAAPCSCGAAVRACPTWQHWLTALPESVQMDYRHWTPEILDRLRVAAGKSVLVDSSKSRTYRVIERWRRNPAAYVLILRDPRGVLCSDLRRGAELEKELATHRKWMRRYDALVRKHPRQSFTLHYEDVVGAPEQTLRGLCGFVGLAFDPAMLAPDNRTHHFIRASTSGYLKGSNTLRRDERWRQELTPAQLERIGRMLGDLACYDRYRLTERPD
ncbi:MAG: sulfotransferase [Verrucomicrobia bacterium]|nr:sulfotransferase [Verrucomicrobiota bacterium]